ncbi:MAG: hypothetical protein K0B87_07575 [Candidatus Syntrophosphaera sp.]|nr:hypothetical protein [Candidatus Syntrophosphaera sp.]
MKRALIIAILASACLVLAGQGISSFRNLSTGGVLDDTADLAFDPIELNYIEGTHIFSNLSNFSSEDRIYANDGANHLLIGLATDKCMLENLKRALLFKYYDLKEPGMIDYYIPGDDRNMAWGEVENIWQEYYDTNGNGLYDRHYTYSQHYQNWVYDKGWEFFLNHAYEISDKLRAGLKLGWVNETYGHNLCSSELLDFEPGDYSTHTLETLVSLEENDPGIEPFSRSEEITGDFGGELQSGNFLGEFALAKQLDHAELRGSLLLELVDSDLNVEDAAEQIYLAENTNEAESEAWDYKQTKNGFRGGLALGYRKVLKEQERRQDEGYLSLQGSISLVSFDNQISEIGSYDYNDNETELGSEDYSQEMTGDVSGLEMMARLRLHYPLNRRTWFGTGLAWSHLNHKEEGDYDFHFSSQDDVYLEEGEWLSTQTRSHGISGTTQHNLNETNLVVPVGLEYWFANNLQWALRFGSIFSQSYSTETRFYEPTNVEPVTVTLTSAANPDPQIYYEDNEYEMETQRIITRDSYTNFTYGLGFRPSENLQIDLMGMFRPESTQLWNTSFFRSLRLSFSIRLK